MTNEEASQRIQGLRRKISKPKHRALGWLETWIYKEDVEALNMASKALEQEPILDKIWNIVFPLSIMSTDKMEHEAIMQIAEMLEPLCLPKSEE